MADLLEQGARWLADQRAASAARLVSYRRGDVSVALPATPSKSGAAAEASAAGAALVEDYDHCDWLIRASDLILSGVTTRPQPGDQIVEARAGQSVTWEVSAEAMEKCFRESDPYGCSLRVHTKRISG